MKPLKGLLLLIAFLLGGVFLGTSPLQASTVQVGGCLSGVKNYSNITAAVGAVTAGSTVKVCPGIYTEQFIISTPLTLEGVMNGNSDRTVITAQGANLFSNVDSIFGDPVVAQVLVITGPVTISNITVDGTGNNQNNLVDMVGIFFATGSSGTLNGVTAQGQSGNGRGTGLWVENGQTTPESVTIENCDIHDVDLGGIFVGSLSPPTLTATIKGNMIAAPRGIDNSASGSITNNVIAAQSVGISGGGPVLSNTITITSPAQGAKGIVVAPGAIVKLNSIFNLGIGGTLITTGIYAGASGVTMESNTIKDADVGIELFCATGSIVSGNTISDVSVGIDEIPSSQTVTNTYHNVDNIRINFPCR